MSNEDNTGGNQVTGAIGDTGEEIEGIIELVAQQNPEAAERIGQYLAVHRSHSGPMPSPSDLQNYMLIQADLPERMMQMAEKSQANSIERDRIVLGLKEKEIELQSKQITQSSEAHTKETGTQRLGMIFAFLTVLICILGSLYLAIIDKTVVASIIGGATVVGIVTAFIKRSSNKPEDALNGQDQDKEAIERPNNRDDARASTD